VDALDQHVARHAALDDVLLHGGEHARIRRQAVEQGARRVSLNSGSSILKRVLISS
jgi:hypothetical protein